MPYRGNTGVVHRSLVPVGHAVADRLVQQRRATQLLDDDLRRDLALAEARDLHVLRGCARDALQLGLDLGARNLDVEADL